MDRVRAAGLRVATASDFGILTSLFPRNTCSLIGVDWIEHDTRVPPARADHVAGRRGPPRARPPRGRERPRARRVGARASRDRHPRPCVVLPTTPRRPAAVLDGRGLLARSRRRHVRVRHRAHHPA